MFDLIDFLTSWPIHSPLANAALGLWIVSNVGFVWLAYRAAKAKGMI